MYFAICDDTKPDVEAIHKTIIDNMGEMEYKVDPFTSSLEMSRAIRSGRMYDVVFLDVDMPGMNGIELGKLVKSKSPQTEIVFVTSYPQYALEGYDCHAFHYLIKPLCVGKASNVLQRLILRYRESNQFHIIKIKTESIRLRCKDIYYVECCQKHVIYHLKNKKYTTLGTLAEAYKSLRNFGFLQVHQGYIVNLDKISHFDKYSAILCNDEAVPVSVRKRSEVLTAYAQYIEVR